MNTKYTYIVIIVVLLGVVGYLSFNKTKPPQSVETPRAQNLNGSGIGQGNDPGQDKGNNGLTESRGNCLADGCLAIDNLNYPAGELTDVAKTALNKALDDEYKAFATYEAIINKLGSIRPFIMIIRAEEQHISSLKALFDKYGLTIPENPYIGKVTSPETLAEACTAGIEAEMANASLYKDDLLPNVKEYEDITMVFTNLMNASQQKHLTAFQKCAE